MEYLIVELLRAADLLYKASLYHLARIHGYRRCLLSAGILDSDPDGAETMKQKISNCGSEKMILAMVRM